MLQPVCCLRRQEEAEHMFHSAPSCKRNATCFIPRLDTGGPAQGLVGRVVEASLAFRPFACSSARAAAWRSHSAVRLGHQGQRASATRAPQGTARGCLVESNHACSTTIYDSTTAPAVTDGLQRLVRQPVAGETTHSSGWVPHRRGERFKSPLGGDRADGRGTKGCT
jgi:hypothetical protein